jgi:P-type Cu+ transporter
VSQITLDLEGMTCASCASRIERGLNGLDGVQASVNLATEKAAVRYDESSLGIDELVRAVEAAGYRASVADGSDAAPHDSLRMRLVVAVALTTPLAAIAMIAPLQFERWEWLAFALATPVVFWAGWPFHHAAVRNVRHRAVTMDTLVSLGTLSAWTWSLAALLFVGGADTYFEVAGVITTLILLGRFLEARARRRSGDAIRALPSPSPPPPPPPPPPLLPPLPPPPAAPARRSEPSRASPSRIAVSGSATSSSFGPAKGSPPTESWSRGNRRSTGRC